MTIKVPGPKQKNRLSVYIAASACAMFTILLAVFSKPEMAYATSFSPVNGTLGSSDSSLSTKMLVCTTSVAKRTPSRDSTTKLPVLPVECDWSPEMRAVYCFFEVVTFFSANASISDAIGPASKIVAIRAVLRLGNNAIDTCNEAIANAEACEQEAINDGFEEWLETIRNDIARMKIEVARTEDEIDTLKQLLSYWSTNPEDPNNPQEPH